MYGSTGWRNRRLYLSRCSACEAASFPLGHESYEFMVAALARPLAEVPAASPQALREAERAIGETLEHHGNLRLRAAVAR